MYRQSCHLVFTTARGVAVFQRVVERALLPAGGTVAAELSGGIRAAEHRFAGGVRPTLAPLSRAQTDGFRSCAEGDVVVGPRQQSSPTGFKCCLPITVEVQFFVEF